jgi:hypothetical protein
MVGRTVGLLGLGVPLYVSAGSGRELIHEGL